MKFIIGRKLDMTQIWQSDENIVAVTKVKVDPCVVTQVKTEDKDGYVAIQIGTGEKKEKNMKKPQKGHVKGFGNLRDLKEFRLEDAGEIKKGDKIDLETFQAGDKIQVTAVSKGKGFQGVVKRHGFAGQIKTHGTKDQVRMPGSIGATGPAHVFKGMRMPGRMGGDQVTTKNLEVIDLDLENNIIFIKGSVPGARNGLVFISGEGELKLKVESEKVESKEESESEEVQDENTAEKAEEKKEEVKAEEKKTEKSPENKAETKEDKQEESKE